MSILKKATISPVFWLALVAASIATQTASTPARADYYCDYGCMMMGGSAFSSFGGMSFFPGSQPYMGQMSGGFQQQDPRDAYMQAMVASQMRPLGLTWTVPPGMATIQLNEAAMALGY